MLGVWGPQGTREMAADDQWKNPVRWNKAARAAGRRDRVFCASLADVFEGPETMPGDIDARGHGPALVGGLHELPTLGSRIVATARERLFQLILDTPHLDWLLLTKRPQHVLPILGTWLHFAGGGWAKQSWPANIWVGASVENQARAEERCPHLMRIRAAGCRVVFMSCEPLLGGLDVRPWLDRDRGINWVIAGGESGAIEKIRPLDLMHARTLRDQCGDAGVPYWFKQIGHGVVGLDYKGKGEDIEDAPPDLRVRELPSP